jgi:predicted ferric reductase
MKHDPTFWYLARASGITAYVFMTAAMIAGLVVKSRPFGAAVKPASAIDVHRFVTTLALGGIVVHILTLVLDSTIEIGLGAVLVPGLSPYKPLWTGLGVLAAELAVLVIVSFPLRRRIGGKNWRRLHWATYAIFVLSTAHGLAAGTDSGQVWAMDMYLGAVGAVAFATVYRVLTRRPKPVPKPNPQPRGDTHVQDRNRPVAV